VPTDILSTLDGSESFTKICNALDIDMDLSVKPARYIEVSSKQPNALVVMVLNHQAMSQLLVRLGQPNHKDDPQSTSITTYSAGLTFCRIHILTISDRWYDPQAEEALQHLEGYQIFLDTRWSCRNWDNAMSQVRPC
jgi:hypothetical protein